MTIIFGIIFLFVSLGLLIPIIKVDLGGNNDTYTSISDYENPNEIKTQNNALTYILSILGMFTWTFGNIVWVWDLLVFVPIRIIFYLTLARNIWVGGGS